MQLKDKLDFSFLKTKQKTISKVVFTVLKFVIVAAVAYGVFTVLNLLFFNYGIKKEHMVFVFAVIFILSLASCTVGLMKNLYFADDNKVLITLPVNSNLIFISRLVVYYVFELKRSLFLTIPIFIAFGIMAKMSVLFYIWLFVAFVFISALPVLFGALLSIPAMYVYTFVKKRAALKAVIYVAAIAAVVFAAVKVIGLIPESINLIQQKGEISANIDKFLNGCRVYCYPVNYLTTMLCGNESGFSYNLLVKQVPIYFAVLAGTLLILFGLSYLISRPLFFSMMSNTFEFEKIPPKKPRRDIKRKKAVTFFRAELTSLLRSGFVGTFVAMYIIVPVMIYLLNKIFAAMDTKLSGVYMVYAFNVLIMILPMLASNALIATIYSREGRAAYVTKTMPLNPRFPLLIKLAPMAAASAVSLVISVVIFSRFVSLTAGQLILLSIGLIGIQWGHILWSGMLDLMNPQNEQYATFGEMNDNPNENFATITAFIVAAVYALYSFILFPEGVTSACVKLCVMGVVFAAILAYMFLNKVKVYYFEK